MFGASAETGTITPRTAQCSPFGLFGASAAAKVADCTTAPDVGNPIALAGMNVPAMREQASRVGRRRLRDGGSACEGQRGERPEAESETFRLRDPDPS